MERHDEKWFESFCAHAGNSASALKLAETPCRNDHRFSFAYLDSLEELAPVCAHIGLKCLCSAGLSPRWHGHEVERTLCQKIGRIEKVFQPHETSQAMLCCWKQD